LSFDCFLASSRSKLSGWSVESITKKKRAASTPTSSITSAKVSSVPARFDIERISSPRLSVICWASSTSIAPPRP